MSLSADLWGRNDDWLLAVESVGHVAAWAASVSADVRPKGRGKLLISSGKMGERHPDRHQAKSWR